RSKLADRLALPLPTGSWDLLLLDLDGFKEINDTVGHDIGDQLLRGVATRLCACVPQGGSVSRLGGDEFAILLPPNSLLEHATEVAERVILNLSNPFHMDGNEVVVSASIGIASRNGLE